MSLVFPLILPIILLAVGIPTFCLLSIYHLKQERQWLYSIIERLKLIENDLTEKSDFKFWDQCVQCTKNGNNPCNDISCYLYQQQDKCSQYYQLLDATNNYHEQILPLIFWSISVMSQIFAYFLVYVYIVPSATFLKPDFSMIMRNPNLYALGLELILTLIILTSLFFYRIYIDNSHR